MATGAVTVRLDVVGLVTVMSRAQGGCIVRIESSGEEQVLDREYQQTVMDLMGGSAA